MNMDDPEFNFYQWTADTQLTLCNVRWNNDYRDIWRPDDWSKVDRYIDAMGASNIRITNASYAKLNQPVRINVPFNRALRYNYLRASNPIQPIPGGDIKRSYYYFIIGVDYVAPNTTEITVQLDVWQTFGPLVKFGNCFVNQSHLLIAAENAFNRYGRDFLSMPEGQEIGGDYRTIRTYATAFGGRNDEYAMIASTTSLMWTPGTEKAPVVKSAQGSTLQGVQVPVEAYAIKRSDIASYFRGMKDYPWITQGIISVAMMPNLEKFKPSGETQALSPRSKTVGTTYPPGPNNSQTYLRWPLATEGQFEDSMAPSWRTMAMDFISSRYRHLRKFLTYPYCTLELTAWQGSPIELKPEAWQSPDAKMTYRLSTIPGNERVVGIPNGYNAFDDKQTIKYGDYLDAALFINNLPKLPVINDGAALAMANTAGSRAAQRQGAQWAFQKASASNQASYDNATTGINLGNELGAIGRSADSQSTRSSNDFASDMAVVRGIEGLVQGGASGAIGGAVGGPAGVGIGAGVGLATSGISGAMGIMNTNLQNQQNLRQLSIRQGSSVASGNAQAGAASSIRDTNKGLADFAAKGDYAMSIAAMSAQVQDMQMTPPQMSAQFGGEFMNLIYRDFEVQMRVKLPSFGAIKRVGEYWLRYGYQTNLFTVPPENLHCMDRFTYWRMSETYMERAPMPEIFKQAIRGIFEKGVTVWRDPDDMGMMDISENNPLGGIEV